MAIMRTPGTMRGFTLVELMVTLAVLAILTMVAVPNFRDTIRRSRVSAASNALLVDLHYARAEAINRGQLVSLCPSSNGSSCTAGGVAWEAGWLVYTYPAGAASANTAYVAGNILLRASDAREGVAIRASRAGVLSFGQQGQLRPGTALSFVTCMRNGSGGAAENATAVPGAQLALAGSGSLSNKALAAGAACTP
jgi:prepilin-type N-terminal cleavage/methylation domain